MFKCSKKFLATLCLSSAFCLPTFAYPLQEFSKTNDFLSFVEKHGQSVKYDYGAMKDFRIGVSPYLRSVKKEELPRVFLDIYERINNENCSEVRSKIESNIKNSRKVNVKIADRKATLIYEDETAPKGYTEMYI